jgi:predicted nucleic acid-binding protein
VRLTKAFQADLGFRVLPLSENIGHRASICLEEYGLKSYLGVPDALIAATAVENDEVLCSGNAKDYRDIVEVALKVFRPWPRQVCSTTLGIPFLATPEE